VARREPGRLRELLGVYAITPDGFDAVRDAAALEAALEVGLRAVQYRDKRDGLERSWRVAQVRALVARCRPHGALVIVNDDPGLAVESDADGVHVGPHDMPVEQARAVVGEDRLVGGSAGTLERAQMLVEAGVDYLGVGAIFDASATKPDAVSHRGVEVLTAFGRDAAVGRVPLVAIGGITLDNAGHCYRAGATGVAAVRAILQAPDPAAAVRALLRARQSATNSET
jgi:thiamine-phosphate pyrophosphorylase